MIYQATITFGSTGNVQIAPQLVAVGGTPSAWPTNPTIVAKRVLVEPLRANTGPAWVGTSNLGNTGANKIQELATPQSTSTLDRFMDEARGSDHSLDILQYYVAGGNTQAVTVTVWTL